tara:strand:- start:907 stop:1686 length:780 start_codon:yes stop_codon:yes gene_type:complete
MMKMNQSMKTLLPLAALALTAATTNAATYLGTDTYTGYSDQATSANDSPFSSIFGTISQQDPDGGVGETTSVYDFRGLTSTVAAASSDTYFFLEDVQDGQFDTPGVSFSGGGVVARTADGRNSSNNGGSNTDNVAEDILIRSSFRIVGTLRADFSAASLGGELPTYVGLVFAERTNQLTREIIAYDSDDNVLETLTQVSGSQVSDQFLGLSTATGISYVTVTGDNEYDHFQYGFQAVPEPTTTALLGLGGLALILRRRK